MGEILDSSRNSFFPFLTKTLVVADALKVHIGDNYSFEIELKF